MLFKKKNIVATSETGLYILIIQNFYIFSHSRIKIFFIYVNKCLMNTHASFQLPDRSKVIQV